MPSLFRLLTVIADPRRRRLWRPLCAGAFRAAEVARDQRVDPARQVLQEPLRAPPCPTGPTAPRTMARATVVARHARDAFRRAADRALSRHAGGRARRRREHACRLSAATLTISPSTSPDTGRSIATAYTEDLRAYLGDLARRGMTAATVARRLSAIRQLYRFLYAEGQRNDDPAAVLEGPKRVRTLPKTLTLAEVDRLLRVADDLRSGGAAGRAAARGAARLPGRDALRDGPARLRARRLAGIRRAPRRARHRRARQGQQGAHGAAQRRGQARDGGLSRAARASGPRGEIEMAVPVVRRERPSHAPASRPRTENARRRRGPARRASEPARAAPRLRQPPPAQRRRPARGADAARPCRYFDHADLHPCAGRAPEKPGARFAPAGDRNDREQNAIGALA